MSIASIGSTGTVVALSGGVGGAKLAYGLDRVLAPGRLSIVANTGDDFQHLGLPISPDIDTLLYSLSDLADPERGWGRRHESWQFLETLKSLGGPDWFQLGDRDLALHVLRGAALAQGQSLTEFTDHIRQRLDIASRILSMTDDPVRTQLRSGDRWLDFQDYFVRQHCEPIVSAIRYFGAGTCRASDAVSQALSDPRLRAVVICPSNPMLSIEPILAIPAIAEALRASGVPVIAVSPIISGHAVKGPTAKLMRELGTTASAEQVARRYAGLVNIFIADTADRNCEVPPGMKVAHAPILMRSLEDRVHLAKLVLSQI